MIQAEQTTTPSGLHQCLESIVLLCTKRVANEQVNLCDNSYLFVHGYLDLLIKRN